MICIIGKYANEASINFLAETSSVFWYSFTDLNKNHIPSKTIKIKAGKDNDNPDMLKKKGIIVTPIKKTEVIIETIAG